MEQISSTIKNLLIRQSYAFSGGSIEGGAGSWPFGNVGQIREQFLSVALLVGGILALALIIYGAIRYITSGGDKMQADSARKIITAAVIGLIILVAVYPIGWVLGKVLGVPVVGGFDWPSPGGGGGSTYNPPSSSTTTGCLQTCLSAGTCTGVGFKANTHYACHSECRSEGGMVSGCYLECDTGCNWVTVDENQWDHCEC